MFKKEKERLIKQIENLLPRINSNNSLEIEYDNIYDILGEVNLFKDKYYVELKQNNIAGWALYGYINDCEKYLIYDNLNFNASLNFRGREAIEKYVMIRECLSNMKPILEDGKKNKFMIEREELVVRIGRILTEGNLVQNEVFNLLDKVSIFLETYKEDIEEYGRDVSLIHNNIVECKKYLSDKNLATNIESIKECLNILKSMLD